MGRGGDEQVRPAPSRRNPFRQEIALSKKEKARISEEKKEQADKEARIPIVQFLKEEGWEEISQVSFRQKRDDTAALAARQELLSELGLDGEDDPFWSVAHMLDDFAAIDPSQYSTNLDLHNPEVPRYVLSDQRDSLAVGRGSDYVAPIKAGEEKKIMKEIEEKKEELAGISRERFVHAAKKQAKVAEVLQENGIDDFSKNSPAGELLRQIAENDLFLSGAAEGAYLIPEAYRPEVSGVSYSEGKAWRVHDPFSGRVMAGGHASSEEEGWVAAEAVVREAHGNVIDKIKEKERVFGKRKKVFAGLDAVVGKKEKGSLPGFLGRETNLAVDLEIKGLKRKDLNDGYSLVVGQRVFRTFEPQNTMQRAVDITGIADFIYKKKEDLLLVFKDGELLEDLSSGFAETPSSENGSLGGSGDLFKEGQRRIAKGRGN